MAPWLHLYWEPGMTLLTPQVLGPSERVVVHSAPPGVQDAAGEQEGERKWPGAGDKSAGVM